MEKTVTSSYAGFVRVFLEGPGFLAHRACCAELEAAKGFPENKLKYLPRHWRAVYTCIYLDAEVRNGGFHQFFWNSENSLNDWILSDLDLIGSKEISQIASDALRLHRGYDYPEEKKAAGLSWDSFAQCYDEERFEICDKAYYRSAEDLPMMVGAFIRVNTALYGDSA